MVTKKFAIIGAVASTLAAAWYFVGKKLDEEHVQAWEAACGLYYDTYDPFWDEPEPVPYESYDEPDADYDVPEDESVAVLSASPTSIPLATPAKPHVEYVYFDGIGDIWAVVANGKAYSFTSTYVVKMGLSDFLERPDHAAFYIGRTEWKPAEKPTVAEVLDGTIRTWAVIRGNKAYPFNSKHKAQDAADKGILDGYIALFGYWELA